MAPPRWLLAPMQRRDSIPTLPLWFSRGFGVFLGFSPLGAVWQRHGRAGLLTSADGDGQELAAGSDGPSGRGLCAGR